MIKFTGKDFQVLKEYGYTYSVSEGSWISADKATVISEDRSPYQRQINQYRANVETEHKQNISVLVNAGLCEE